MKKSLFPLGIVILVVSLILAVVGPISAAGDCLLEIHKQDQDGNALFGATFVINPDPTSEPPGTGELTVVDNGVNDENAADGVLLITSCNYDPDIEYTVTETIAPPGYTPAAPQTVKIDSIDYYTEPLTLIFINEPPVGGEVQSVNTVSVIFPWIGLTFVVAAGILFAVKRHASISK